MSICAVVHDPAARIGCDVDSRAGQEDRADRATIFPVQLEWIFPCVPLQNVAREILDTRTCRPEAQRDIKRFRCARLDVAARDHERIAGSGRGIRRMRHIDGTFQIVTAKIERAGSDNPSGQSAQQTADRQLKESTPDLGVEANPGL